jgi:hypothetical protein
MVVFLKNRPETLVFRLINLDQSTMQIAVTPQGTSQFQAKNLHHSIVQATMQLNNHSNRNQV